MAKSKEGNTFGDLDPDKGFYEFSKDYYNIAKPGSTSPDRHAARGFIGSSIGAGIGASLGGLTGVPNNVRAGAVTGGIQGAGFGYQASHYFDPDVPVTHVTNSSLGGNAKSPAPVLGNAGGAQPMQTVRGNRGARRGV